MYDAIIMRTTLTLDPDLAERIRQETASGRVSLKEVINSRLRIGFGITRSKPWQTFRVKAHASGYRPGVDALKLNRLVDELEAGEFLKKAGRRPA